jgi:hypothetical protein
VRAELLKITRDEWLARGKQLFGEDFKQWKFVCPVCSTPQSINDLLAAGVKNEVVANYIGFSCIGRFTEAKAHKKNDPPGAGCDWTLGGFFSIHKVEVTDDQGKVHPVFEFATREEK